MSECIENTENKSSNGGCGCLVILALLIPIAVLLPSLITLISPRDRIGYEGQNNIGAINRSQQAYFLENNSFGNSLNSLGIGIQPETANYRYSIEVTDNTAFHYATSLKPNLVKAKTEYRLGFFPRQVNHFLFPSYVGVVWLTPKTTADYNVNEGDRLLRSILCELTPPQSSKEVKPVFEEGDFICPEGMRQLGL